MSIRDKISKWNDLLRCKKCGAKEHSSEIIDSIEGIIVCEKKIYCKKCGAYINYWAYGFYEYETKLQQYACESHWNWESSWFKRRINKIKYWALYLILKIINK